MQNEERRERIVETALEMFSARGCSGVTMDDIAQSARISKRTLYETFANKEELLNECLTQVHSSIMEMHRKAHEQVDEPMLVAMFMLREGTMVQRRYQLLLEESARYYPEIHGRFFSLHTEHLKAMIHRGFEYMREHNYLRQAVDEEVMVSFFCDFMQHWCSHGKGDGKAYAHRFNEVCFNTLRGLMSIEAIERYEHEEAHFHHVMEQLELSDKQAQQQTNQKLNVQ